MANRTNSKIVRTAIQNHIKEHYDERGVAGVVEDMRAVARGNYGIEAARALVEGGNFLISYYDQREFLQQLELNGGNENYTDDQVFKLYVELLAREILAIHNDYMYTPAE